MSDLRKTNLRFLITVCFFLLFVIFTGCENNNPDSSDSTASTVKPLSGIEKAIVGTWYYYSSSYSEYRCITFNSDRTACYFEISYLSGTATKDNNKCYSDWYVDEDASSGPVYDVKYIGDNTGGVYYAGYTINTGDYILRKNGTIANSETSKIECNICN